MNTFVTFFASIIGFFSGLLGLNTVASPQPVTATPLQMQELTQETATSTQGVSKFYEGRGVVEPRESKATIIGNSATATINNDFGHGAEIIYTTKNKSRTYFALYKETEGQECVPLNYLDSVSSQYVNTKLYYCPGFGGSPIPDVDKKDALPLVVQYGKFDLEKLYALNLEKEQEILIYTKKSNEEGLAARCADGMYDFIYVPDIQSLGKKKIRIGVYKNVVDFSKPCIKEENYPKMRDDIIDLSQFL